MAQFFENDYLRKGITFDKKYQTFVLMKKYPCFILARKKLKSD